VKRAWVFASGEFDTTTAAQLEKQQQDVVVCVDGGLRHCVDIGWTPDWLVGDMDSLDPVLLESLDLPSLHQVTFASEKDASDLQLALLELLKLELDEVVLLGVSGGRTDHMLFNWMLPLQHDWPFRLRLIDRQVDAFVVRSDQALQVTNPIGTTLSLLALSATTGVNIQGVRYPLTNATIDVGSTLGLSNETCVERVSIAIGSGTLLAMTVNRPTS